MGEMDRDHALFGWEASRYPRELRREDSSGLSEAEYGAQEWRYEKPDCAYFWRETSSRCRQLFVQCRGTVWRLGVYQPFGSPKQLAFRNCGARSGEPPVDERCCPPCRGRRR